ncbi:MAG TPA: tRNA epoxyqueuosine(34) reductase QueG [Lacibacter sp.]|nr:tRNA epoxyqueuosine(34) reductase QueG [Lacibacter sp.]HMO89396.1 tRNA epoxyqueuosine(34) reductase QueG [Lacibacter sp.]HMP87159.1 tRNA epoxyqueuosine(34) reductase QueG [Lacibacter sp.]
MNSKSQVTSLIKAKAAALGFHSCGIARAVQLNEDARRLEAWLNKGLHGSMHYMEKHFDLRIDPQKLVPGAKSVITLLLNYFPEEQQQAGTPRIAKYAWGNDYHDVIRGKLNELLLAMQTEIGAVQGRGFVDSAPVLERSWAVRSGLGWVGKNGNLINRQQGSFFFLATLICDLELEYDSPFAKDFCGTCNRCVEACPTEAILPNKVVDGSRCISYFTIELKDLLIPDEMKGRFENWMFGCDTCQDVCPWNRFSQPTTEPAFRPLPEILNLSTREWEALTEERFRELFRHSPLKRSKYSGIRRNLQFIQDPSGSCSLSR